MKRAAVFVSFVVLMSLAALASAQNQGSAPDTIKGRHEGGIVALFESLNLTPEQKHRVALILKEGREQAKPLREALKSARVALRGVMDKTPGDEAAVRQAAKAVAGAREELTVHFAKMKAKLDAILTPEQKAKSVELRDNMKEKVKVRGEKRRQAMDAWIESNTK